MDPEELLRRIDKSEAPFVLDVRTGPEYAAGHVPGAVHAPFQRVRRHLSQLPADRTALVVVYCGHGPRARIAGIVLRRLGFTNLAYLKGHWAGWRRRGLREERKSPHPERR